MTRDDAGPFNLRRASEVKALPVFLRNRHFVLIEWGPTNIEVVVGMRAHYKSQQLFVAWRWDASLRAKTLSAIRTHSEPTDLWVSRYPRLEDNAVECGPEYALENLQLKLEKK